MQSLLAGEHWATTYFGIVMLQLFIIIHGLLLGVALGVWHASQLPHTSPPALPMAIVITYGAVGVALSYTILFAGQQANRRKSKPAKVTRVRRQQTLRPFDQRLINYLHCDPTQLDSTTQAKSTMPYWSLSRSFFRIPLRSSEQIMAVLQRIRELVSQRTS